MGELWRADVIKLAVEHETEGLLGWFPITFEFSIDMLENPYIFE